MSDQTPEQAQFMQAATQALMLKTQIQTLQGMMFKMQSQMRLMQQHLEQLTLAAAQNADNLLLLCPAPAPVVSASQEGQEAQKPAETENASKPPPVLVLPQHRYIIDTMAALVGERGLIKTFLSPSVYPGSRGFLCPVTDADGELGRYQEDAKQVPPEHLVEWPSGFYRNSVTGNTQLLLRCKDFIMRVELEKVSTELAAPKLFPEVAVVPVSEQHPRRLQALTVVELSEEEAQALLSQTRHELVRLVEKVS